MNVFGKCNPLGKLLRRRQVLKNAGENVSFAWPRFKDIKLFGLVSWFYEIPCKVDHRILCAKHSNYMFKYITTLEQDAYNLNLIS